MNNNVQDVLKKLVVTLTNNQGEDRTFLEVANDIRLVYNKLSSKEREHVIAKLFY